jgi:hypothetical protein
MFCNQPFICEKLNYISHVRKCAIRGVSEDKKRIVKNLYLSNIAEEFVAMQVDLEIPVVISILKELDVYRGKIDYDTY